MADAAPPTIPAVLLDDLACDCPAAHRAPAGIGSGLCLACGAWHPRAGLGRTSWRYGLKTAWTSWKHDAVVRQRLAKLALREARTLAGAAAVLGIAGRDAEAFGAIHRAAADLAIRERLSPQRRRHFGLPPLSAALAAE